MRFMVRMLGLVLLGGAAVLRAQAPAPAVGLQATPGEFVVEHPTLINLGFEWHITGDSNRNARVDVTFRKPGETAWRAALPLLRLGGEQVYWRNIFNLVLPDMFAGSLLDLDPDTVYEARFVLTDPDGVRGGEAAGTHVVTVRTRREPRPADGGRVFHVYPGEVAGPEDRAGVSKA
jgi:hypothetical protein